MKASFVSIDGDKYWKDKLKEKKEDIFFLRGFFIDKTIDIENKLIYIIVQYCSEDEPVYNSLGYVLMKKDISFSTLIRIFNSSNILKNFEKVNMTETEINDLKVKLLEIPEIRNKFAHWIHINSENVLYNSDKEEKITEKQLYDYYDKFVHIENMINTINTSFLKWDGEFVMYKNWSNSKKKRIHNNRIKDLKDLIKKELSNKRCAELFKPINNKINGVL